MNVAGWRIYYTDDRQYSSHDHDWQALPRDGVLHLTVYYDEIADGGTRYSTNHSGHDWFFHQPGTDLFGSNSDPLSENWLRYPDCVFKRGQWAAKSELDRIRDAAKQASFPPTTTDGT